jgi:membrane associated rhomboid family serine protease
MTEDDGAGVGWRSAPPSVAHFRDDLGVCIHQARPRHAHGGDLHQSSWSSDGAVEREVALGSHGAGGCALASPGVGGGGCNDGALAPATAAAEEAAAPFGEAGAFALVDNVLGVLNPGALSPPSPCLIAAACCCPCFTPPICSIARQLIYRRIVRSCTLTACIVQVAVLASSIAVGGLQPLRENPWLGPSAAVLVRFGAKNAPLIVDGQVWRLVTAMFNHAGCIHAALNLFVELRVLLAKELQWGTPAFSAVFLLGGAVSTLTSCVFLPDTIGVGASGAILAVLGAWMVQLGCACGSREEEPVSHPADGLSHPVRMLLLALDITVVLLLSFLPGVDWAAHAGGLFAGVCAGLVLFTRHFRSVTTRRGCAVLGAACGAAWVITASLLLALGAVPLDARLKAFGN